MEELKELVIQTLDTNGVLAEIRAKIRSNVFKAVESQESKRSGLPDTNFSTDDVFKTDEGEIMFELMLEFFERYKLGYTLNTFLPECRLRDRRKEPSYLEKKLGVTRDGPRSCLEQFLAGLNSPADSAPLKSEIKAPRGLKLPALNPQSPEKFSVESAESEKKHLSEIESTMKELEEQSRAAAMISIPPAESNSDIDMPRPGLQSSEEENIEEEESEPIYSDEFEIDEEIESEVLSNSEGEKHFLDSLGASGSMGMVDASANSAVLEGYDIVESVNKLQ